jgi:outer membrane protein TolC
LQRVQYESDLQTAEVNLRTAKIQLLALLNDQTPVEQFDVTGPYDFSAQLPLLADVRQAALDVRPDLRAALQSITKASRSQAGGCEWVHRSHIQLRCWDAIPPSTSTSDSA